MTATTSTMTFAPHQPSPLARTISPFRDPRPAPHTPGRTAQLWDEYERMAVENARRREGKCPSSPHSQRCSASDIPRNSSTSVPSARSSFDYKFRSRQMTTSSAAVATCKACSNPITCDSGICQPCKKFVVLPLPTGESTPPLSPTARNFASMDLNLLHKKLSQEEAKTMPMATSPKRISFCPIPAQLLDPPIRLSSLRPPQNQEPAPEAPRARKASLTDPNEPFLRLKITQGAATSTGSYPPTPTYPPTTPPSTSHSRSSTRPSSIANTMSPLSPAVHIPTQAYARHHSATPSELSTLYPYMSTTSRPSVSSTGYNLQHTTSAWDDWDSDSEGEKTGLVSYLKKASKSKRKERNGSQKSIDTTSLKLSAAREEERKKSRESRRSKDSKEDAAMMKMKNAMTQTQSQTQPAVPKKKRPSGFMRALSCGGCSED